MQEINFWRTFSLFRFVICWYATPYSFANSDSVHPPFNVSNKTFVLDEDSNLLFPPSLLFFYIYANTSVPLPLPIFDGVLQFLLYNQYKLFYIG